MSDITEKIKNKIEMGLSHIVQIISKVLACWKYSDSSCGTK